MMRMGRFFRDIAVDERSADPQESARRFQRQVMSGGKQNG
jgi:hypothetical protein